MSFASIFYYQREITCYAGESIVNGLVHALRKENYEIKNAKSIQYG